MQDNTSQRLAGLAQKCERKLLEIFSMAANHCCHEVSSKSVSQTLDEMDFERGIWQAAVDGNYSRVKLLLEKGTSPDVRDSAGYTALHYACRAGHTQIVKLLFEFNANPNMQTAAGKDCPIHRAAYQGHEDVTELLIKNGADPMIQNADGETALHKAVQKNQEKIVELLLKSCPGQ